MFLRRRQERATSARTLCILNAFPMRNRDVREMEERDRMKYVLVQFGSALGASDIAHFLRSLNTFCKKVLRDGGSRERRDPMIWYEMHFNTARGADDIMCDSGNVR